jgi:hypothetical protein
MHAIQPQIKLEPISGSDPASGTATDASMSFHTDGVDRSANADRIRMLRERHWTMLWLAIFVIVASFTLQQGEDDAVILPIARIQLPQLCGSRALFNMECPGCGLTRSFLALSKGDIQHSFQLNRVGCLMAFAIVAQIPYRTYALWELKRRMVERIWPTLFGNFLIVALIANWVFKMNGW